MATGTDSISNPAATFIAFGPFRVFPMQRLLTEAGKPVHIGSRAFDILIALLERPGELVSKEELIARAWPNTFVGSANLAVQIVGLRRALGQEPRGNRYVLNIPGRGYRFVAPVRVETDCSSEAAAAAPAREHNLPAHATRPIARAESFGEAAQKLQQRRVLTIVRPRGIGNTALALALVEKLLGAHEESVMIVNVTSLERS